MAEITTILQLVAWGASLSLNLYEFGASVSSATRDATRLARGVNLFSLVLRQVGASLKEDGEVASNEALETVQEIIEQCKTVFGEIEALIPISQLKATRGSQKPLSLAQKWKWSVHSKSKIQYLVAHLESLKMTLSVMLQTFYTAQVIATSRQLHTFSPVDPVATERLQMETLIMEQQMCFVRAHEAYDEYRRVSEIQPHERPESPALPEITEGPQQESTPAALVRYQDPSLVELDAVETETEKLSTVRRKATNWVEYLLERWTKVQEIEERLRKLELNAQDSQQRERRYKQQPTVESGSSSDDAARIRKVEDYTSFSRVRPEINLKRASVDTSLPIPIPQPQYQRRTSAMSGTSPKSPLSQRPWTPGESPNYFPTSPANTMSPMGYSPSSPRTSFSVDHPAAQAFDPGRRDSENGLRIPWRLGFLGNWWDFIDTKLVNSNNQLPPTSVGADRKAYTEIVASWVCKEAIEEMDYKYLHFQRTVTDGSKTSLESCFRINWPLSFPEVEKLVEITAAMYRQRQQQKQQRSSASSSSRPRLPPLDRSRTAPGNPFAGSNRSTPTTPTYLDPSDVRRSRRHREHQHGSSSSPYSSDSESDHAWERGDRFRHASTSSRRRSGEERRRSGGEERDRRRSGDDRERSRHSSSHSHSERRHSHEHTRAGKEKDKSHGKSYAMGKVAQGVGFAALLDGLAEGLSGISD